MDGIPQLPKTADTIEGCEEVFQNKLSFQLSEPSLDIPPASQHGLFRKMRYIPKVEEDEASTVSAPMLDCRPGIDLKLERQNVCLFPHKAVSSSQTTADNMNNFFRRPQSPGTRKDYSSMDANTTNESRRGSNPDVRRAFHGRSGSPHGRLRDTQGAIKSPNISPRRSLSPRRGIVGKVLGEPPAGIFSRMVGAT